MQPRATSVAGVRAGVRRFGVAQGPRKLLVREEEAATLALETGVYATWRSRAAACTRVGPRSLCFCGHSYADHAIQPSTDNMKAGGFTRKPCGHGRRKPGGEKKPSSARGAARWACRCPGFAFMPSRPEEVGDYWLVKRRGFNINTWRCKCRCGHTHEEHDPNTRRCRSCGCGAFQSNFLCVVCDKHWEDHDTVFENEQERRAVGLPVGADFLPLALTPDIREAVFRGDSAGKQKVSAAPARSLEDRWQRGEISAQEYQRLVLAEGDNSAIVAGAATAAATGTIVHPGMQERRRQLNRPQPKNRRPERSVRLSHVSSGGTAHGRVVNRWGKVEPTPNRLKKGAGSRRK